MATALLSQTAIEPVFTHTPTTIDGETSVCYTRADGRKVEMVVLHFDRFTFAPAQLIIVIGTEEELEREEYYQFLNFSIEEARVLSNHLNCSDVQTLLGVQPSSFPTLPTPITAKRCDYPSEVCITFDRSDGRTAEITVTYPDCVIPDTYLLISVGTEEEMEMDSDAGKIRLPVEETRILRDFLNRPEVVTLIGA